MKVSAGVFVLLTMQLVSAQFEVTVDEMAPYTVTKVGQGYEERAYPPVRWVCHGTTSAKPSTKAMQSSFFPLFRYITGLNDRAMKIPMTAPVTMLGEQFDLAGWMYQMCFYLPKDHQESPPQPLNPETFIQDRPAMTVFVRRFGGFALIESQWESEAAKLRKNLEAAGETNIDYSAFYRAGYNSPMEFENRRNEVWFKRKN